MNSRFFHLTNIWRTVFLCVLSFTIQLSLLVFQPFNLNKISETVFLVRQSNLISPKLSVYQRVDQNLRRTMLFTVFQPFPEICTKKAFNCVQKTVLLLNLIRSIFWKDIPEYETWSFLTGFYEIFMVSIFGIFFVKYFFSLRKLSRKCVIN